MSSKTEEREKKEGLISINNLHLRLVSWWWIYERKKEDIGDNLLLPSLQFEEWIYEEYST
jgi:hypothetical protein